MTVDLPNVAVAVTNTGSITLYRQFGIGKTYEFPKPVNGKVKPVVVPFHVAHSFFGFEIKNGRLVRNTDDKYDDGTETSYYASRASYLPWGWEHNKSAYNPEDPADKQVSKEAMFRRIRDTWENHIDAKMVNQPKEMSIEQYEAL
jgi:hypothetical protein